MPAPFLQRCPSTRHGHFRVLFPDSFPVFPKGNRSFIGPLSGQTRNIPDLHPETNRPPADNQRQPVMKKPFARIFANTSKTKALFPQNSNRHLRQPDRPKRSPCRFFRHQPFHNKSVPCPDNLWRNRHLRELTDAACHNRFGNNLNRQVSVRRFPKQRPDKIPISARNRTRHRTYRTERFRMVTDCRLPNRKRLLSIHFSHFPRMGVRSAHAGSSSGISRKCPPCDQGDEKR